MRYRLIAIVLLLIMGWLELSTLAVTNPTADEPTYMVRGYAFVTLGKDRILSCNPCSPILSGILIGASLRMEPNLQLPSADDPIWTEGSGFGVHQVFMWANSVPPERITFWGRLPIIFVSLLLGALIFRWAAQRSGAAYAVGALVLYVFCPNLLAHARLATTDVVAAATFAFSAYAFDRARRRPRRSSRLASGVALGLALAAKIAAACLPIAFVLQAIVYAWQRRGVWRERTTLFVTALVTCLVGGLTLWAAYRFTVAPLSPGGIPLPAPAYWLEVRAVSEYLKDPLPAYLFGQISYQGWWYYYPIAFLVKTPLPVLIILVLGLARTIRTRSWASDFALLLAPGLYFVSLLFSGHDLGYRYLLPVLPFIFVYSAGVFSAASRAHWPGMAIGLLLIWQVVGTLRIYPYYLTYFNELAGGPDGGRYILSDSNLDWGQDLIGLKHYVEQQHLDHIKLSYFGIAHPTAYGLQTEGLPPIRDAMADQGTWWLHTYYPPDPAPGSYAISVANLMGGIWTDQNTYAFFRDRRPEATVGNSIYLYDIPTHGTPIDLSLAGVQIDQIDPNTYRRFGTNEVRLRWFDATTSLIAPRDQAWIAVGDRQPVAEELAAAFKGVTPEVRARTVYDDQAYSLYHFDLGARLQTMASQSEQMAVYPDQTSTLVPLPVKFSDAAECLGYRLLRSSNDLKVVTFWRAADHIAAPLQLFVHIVGLDGTIVAQDDRLDASPLSWRAGDLIAQVNHLHLPSASQDYQIEIGLYHPDSGQRLPALVAGREVDRLRLR